MALVLAIEPDLRQGAILKRIVREKVKADVVIVDSRDAAVEAIRAAVPDVMLLSALLSPRDEDELVAYLRTMEGAGHLQTHTIPQLASSLAESEGGGRGRGLLKAFRRKKNVETTTVPGCDPELFADEIRMFLEQAAQRKKEQVEERRYASPHAPAVSEVPTAATAPDQEAAPSGSSSPSWDSPFEWRRSPSYAAESAPDQPHGDYAGTPDAPNGLVSNVADAIDEPIAAAEPETYRAVASEVVPEPMPYAEVDAQPDLNAVEPAEHQMPAADMIFEPPVAVAAAVEPLELAPSVETPVVFETVEPIPSIPGADDAPVSWSSVGSAERETEPAIEAPVIDLGELRVEPANDFHAAVAFELASAETPATPPADAGRARVAHLGPLSAWARVEAYKTPQYEPPSAQHTLDLIARIAIPGHVAGVSYGSGVRIRRVRVPATNERRKPAQRLSGAVILSRKALEQRRSLTR